MTAAVLAHLRRPPAASWRPWVRRVAATMAALVVVVSASAAVSPQVRAALSDVLRFFGVELHPGAGPRPQGPGTLPGERQVSLEESRRQAAAHVYVPSALGRPDVVILGDGVPPRVVSLVYRAGPGRPAPSAGDVAARLDEFDGRLGPVFEKYLGAAEAEPVRIAGARGVWLRGPHDVIYVDRSGEPRFKSARLAANTLIWEVGGVTLRLEGDFTRDQAVAVAESLR